MMLPVIQVDLPSNLLCLKEVLSFLWNRHANTVTYYLRTYLSTDAFVMTTLPKLIKKKIKGTYKHVSSRYAPAYISVYST